MYADSVLLGKNPSDPTLPKRVLKLTGPETLSTKECQKYIFSFKRHQAASALQ